ncbi:unnamed protein product [Leuciscus chuanchicus]
MSDIPEIQLFPSDDELTSLVSHVRSDLTDPNTDNLHERSGREIQRSYKPRSKRQRSPPPSRSPVLTEPRQSSQTSSLHSTAAITSFPPISKCSVNSLRQVLSSSGIHFSRRSSKAQLYDLFIRSSIPINTSTAHKSKTRPSSTSVSLPVRRSEPTQSQRVDSRVADAATARTSLSAGISTRPTTAAAKNSSASSPVLTNFLQSAPLFRQEPNLQTLSTALPSASPVLSNLLYNNPCARSLSQTVTFLSPSNQPTQIADPSARLPSLAIPPPLSFHSNSPQSFLPPSILQLPPNILPSTHPSVRLPPQRISTPFFPTNPLPLIPAHASHLGHQSVMGPIDQHSSTFFSTNTCSSDTIRLPAHSLSTAVHLPAPPNAVAMEPPPPCWARIHLDAVRALPFQMCVTYHSWSGVSHLNRRVGSPIQMHRRLSRSTCCVGSPILITELNSLFINMGRALSFETQRELSRSYRSVSLPFGRRGGSPFPNRCVTLHVF